MRSEPDTATIERPETPPRPDDDLPELRSRIDDIDRRLTTLLARRTELALEVGRRKRRAGAPLVDPEREAAVVRKAADRARRASLDEEAVRQIYWCVIELSRGAQRDDGR